MADARPLPAPQPEGATGVVVFADGRVVWGRGFGAEGEAVGELCFNTAMTGYQEVMTDPSYARQVIAFTFPHIGNVGANDEDVEAARGACAGLPGARGGDRSRAISAPSQDFAELDGDNGGGSALPGVDTRALTRLVRERRAADDRHRASARTGSSISRRCSRWRRSGRGSRGWTWPRRSAARRSSAGAAGSGRWGAGLSSMGGDDDSAPARRRDRLWRQAQHLPQPGRGRGAGDGRAGDGELRRGDGARARRLLPVERAGRPGGDRRICGAGDPGRCWRPSKPLFGICLGHQMLALAVGGKTSQDVPGPPRRQPSGQAAGRRPGRDHQHEPRLRGRARGPARQCARDPRVACSTAAIAGSS